MRKIMALSMVLAIAMACNRAPGNKGANELNAEIELNNGDHWQANPETTEGINTMIRGIENFEQSGSDNYEELQDDLLSGFNSIIKQCTMKGEAHEQLHAYLMPLKKEIQNLSANNLDKVKSYLQEYSKYFK